MEHTLTHELPGTVTFSACEYDLAAPVPNWDDDFLERLSDNLLNTTDNLLNTMDVNQHRDLSFPQQVATQSAPYHHDFVRASSCYNAAEPFDMPLGPIKFVAPVQSPCKPMKHSRTPHRANPIKAVRAAAPPATLCRDASIEPVLMFSERQCCNNCGSISAKYISQQSRGSLPLLIEMENGKLPLICSSCHTRIKHKTGVRTWVHADLKQLGFDLDKYKAAFRNLATDEHAQMLYREFTAAFYESFERFINEKPEKRQTLRGLRKFVNIHHDGMCYSRNKKAAKSDAESDGEAEDSCGDVEATPIEALSSLSFKQEIASQMSILPPLMFE